MISCGDDEDPQPGSAQVNIVPENFTVDIPSSISDPNSGGKLGSRNSLFDMSFIYIGLPVFIHIGEASAEIVQEIMTVIRLYNLDKAQSFEFTSDDDGRVKTVRIEEQITIGVESYEYGMEIKDKIDNAIAMQVFWNNSPVEGFAIMNAYQMDRQNNDSSTLNTFYRVRYSENISNADAEMEVWISGIPPIPSDTGSIVNMRMLVSKTADIVTVIGNSHHPYFSFWGGQSGVVGRNYTFRARGDDENEIGIAEVALPPSNTSSVSQIFNTYNILEVCKSEYGDGVESLLFNYKAPGYFSESGGFLGDGDYNADPALWTESFTNLSGLRPFIPRDIRDLQLGFETF